MAAGGGVADLRGSRSSVAEGCKDEESSFLESFFLDDDGDDAEEAAEEKRRRRKEQEAVHAKALRDAKERRDELRRAYAALPPTSPCERTASATYERYRIQLARSGRLRLCSTPFVNKEEEDEEECPGLEPFFYDEAAAVAEHAVAEEKRKRKEQEEELFRQRRKAATSAMHAIRDYDHKLKCPYFTRFHFADLSIFDLDEESPLGPMRYTDSQGDKRYHYCNSVNIFSVKIASSDVGFPVNVYGTFIVRDSLDLKCVYLFRRDRDDCQFINSKDESLILTGPKRGLELVDRMYFEMDLKIKGNQGQKDKQFSKGFLTLDGIPRNYWDKMVVECDSLDTKLSTVEVTFAVVTCAVEATVAIEVLQGEFHGKITACTATIRNTLVLHDSKVASVFTCNGKTVVQLLRNVVAVSLKEKLEVTVVAKTGGGKFRSTVELTPRDNGRDEREITCGSIKMLVKVSWSIIRY
ncbi:hypothetical protein ACP70R_026038 [Stipagrostis hirtigluma subsp. patula]